MVLAVLTPGATEVDEVTDLQPGEPLFYRSVIRSGARLTYGQTERILDGREPTELEIDEGLRLAERLATELRRRRFARGGRRWSAG